MIYKIIVDKQPSTNPTEDKKEYSVDIEELRFLGDVHDSLVITKEEDYVMRRLSLSEYNVLTVLEEPIKEPLSDINIELFEGDNYIYLMDMTWNRFYARYIIKNDFTDTYVTINQMNSSITQTAEKIELDVSQILTEYSTTQEMNSSIQQSASSIISTVNQKLVNYDTTTEVNSKIDQKADSITSTVSATYATKSELNTAKTEIKQTTDSISSTVSKKVGDNEIISQINQTAESATINANKIGLTANNVLDILAGNTINMTSKNIAISSDNFSVTKNGKMTCNNAEITGGIINLKPTTEHVNPYIRVEHGEGEVSFIQGGTISCQSPSGTRSVIETGSITTPILYQTSRVEAKKNFEKLQNALDIIKSIDIYKYNLKHQNEEDKKHIGFVIGEDFNYSKEVTSSNNDGVDIYSFTAVCCKALQEQQETIEKLESRLARLEEKYG